jgi:hypothetical protein
VDDEPIPDLKLALLQTSFNHGTYSTSINDRTETVLCSYAPEKDLDLSRGIRELVREAKEIRAYRSCRRTVYSYLC